MVGVSLEGSLRCIAEKMTNEGRRSLTFAPLGVIAKIGQGAAVDSVVRICGVEAPQKIPYVSEMKMGVTHRVQLCPEEEVSLV